MRQKINLSVITLQRDRRNTNMNIWRMIIAQRQKVELYSNIPTSLPYSP